MRKTKRKVICAECGESFEIDELVSAYQEDARLDGKPSNPALIPHAYECPACHTISYTPDRKEESTDREKAYEALFECWELEEEGKDEAAAEQRVRAAAWFSTSFQSGYDEQDVLTYLDCLRQIGRLFDAANVAAEAQSLFREVYPADAQINKVLSYEISLINAGDTKPHWISEAV